MPAAANIPRHPHTNNNNSTYEENYKLFLQYENRSRKSSSSVADDMSLDTVNKVAAGMTRSFSGNALSAYNLHQEGLNEVEVTEENAMMKLECTAQQYAWGRIGSNSTVARMRANQTEDFVLEEDKPYAELWMGTHPNGMSRVMNEDESVGCTLLEHVQSNPELHLGKPGQNDLTFLFKVLSIEKVLSIQAHPDKKLAEQLHSSRPHVYKDPNHKPEMAVALTDDFEAMCGFRPVHAIVSNLRKFPEFRAVIGEDAAERLLALEHTPNSPSTRSALRNMFWAFNTASDELIQTQLGIMLDRLDKMVSTELEMSRDLKLILKLANQFPGDSGIMAPLMFNHVRLTKGQSFYIGANEPHAYISGEILECMACSDNVVRAGLTPKLKDVDTLVSMLTYKTAVPTITRGKKMDECTTLYAPPVPDFLIELIEVSPYKSYEIDPVKSPSVLLTLNGSAALSQAEVKRIDVAYGSSVFVSANTRTLVQGGSEGVLIARAMSNVLFF